MNVTTIQLLITNAAQILMAVGVLVTAVGVLWNGRLALKNKIELKKTRFDLTEQLQDNTDKTTEIGKTINGQLEKQKQEAFERAEERRLSAITLATLEADKVSALKAFDLAKKELEEKNRMEKEHQTLIDALRKQLAESTGGRRSSDSENRDTINTQIVENQIVHNQVDEKSSEGNFIK